MYTSPKEVEICRNSDLIRMEYEAAFVKRYHSSPFVETDDLPVFAFLSKNFGLDRGKSIVSHYVKMEDEWFCKQAHNAATLRKNINKVIADLGTREGKQQMVGTLTISTNLSCDKCFEEFLWVGNPDDLSRSSYMRMCGNCRGPK